MHSTRILAASLVSLILAGHARAADWPAFRGPEGGVADGKGLPDDWSKDNIIWKVKLPGPGASSPITQGENVFVTCYAGYGTKISMGKSGFGKGGSGRGKGEGGGDQKDLHFLLLCFNGKSGEVVWRKEVRAKLPEAPFSGFISEHGYATSTPTTDGERIFVFFGKTGVLSFDMKGNQLWQTSVGTKTDKWGSGASPILYKDLVIVNAAIESGALVGLDKKSGKEVWRVGGVRTCWSSPLLVETKDGKHEVILNQSGRVVGYDPETGKELWHCKGIGSNSGYGHTASTPVARDGIVYVVGGGGSSSRPVALAVRAGGRGDVNDSHVLWRKDAGTGTSSPVLAGGNLCWISGTLTAVKASDGKTVGSERLYGTRTEYVSPVSVGDRVLALTRSEGLFVVSAGGEKFEKLARLEFDGDSSIFNASPAVSNGRVFVRSNAYLYCLGNKK